MRQAALVVACALALGMPAATWALANPEQSIRDHRIRFVDFDPLDVVQLDAVIGVATQISFAPGEQYVTHAFGDSEAYELSSVQNHLFFKPIAEQANTNLLVVTNQRSYAFRLSYHDSREAKAIYRLEFRYPEEEAARREAQVQEERRREALAKPVPVLNWRGYTMAGDTGLAPTSAWDDGRQTVFQFGPGQEFPAVYLVGADGQERLVNHHVSGPALELMVLHRVAQRWHLRLGDRVLAIENDMTPGDGLVPDQGDLATPQPETATTPTVESVTHDPALAHAPALPNPSTQASNPPEHAADPEATAAATASPEADPVPVPADDHSQAIVLVEVATSSSAVQAPDMGSEKPAAVIDNRNVRYSVVGDVRLQPQFAWDDGERTWLQFRQEPGAAEQILIRAQDRAGELHLVNVKRAGEHGSLAILDHVAPRWLLSRGDAFLVLQNDALVATEEP